MSRLVVFCLTVATPGLSAVRTPVDFLPLTTNASEALLVYDGSSDESNDEVRRRVLGGGSRPLTEIINLHRFR